MIIVAFKHKCADQGHADLKRHCKLLYGVAFIHKLLEPQRGAEADVAVGTACLCIIVIAQQYVFWADAHEVLGTVG